MGFVRGGSKDVERIGGVSVWFGWEGRRWGRARCGGAGFKGHV